MADDLKIQIVGTLEKTQTVNEINKALIEISKKVDKIKLSASIDTNKIKSSQSEVEKTIINSSKNIAQQQKIINNQTVSDIEIYQKKMANAIDRLKIGKEKVFAKQSISDELNKLTNDLNKLGTVGSKNTKQLGLSFDTLRTHVAQTSNEFKNVNKDGYGFIQMLTLAGKSNCRFQ